MSTLKLTPYKDCEDVFTDLQDTTTAGLLEYGLRSGCLDSEYHLANRLEEMRVIALELVMRLLEEGYSVSDTVLKTIDVQKEVIEVKRFSKRD